jgi:flagellar basal-body rod modification protein FlgD
MAVSGIGSSADSPFDPMAATGVPQDQGAMGKDSFMKLLVTQLSNQDPMSPADSTEFISQLAEFTSLEQLVGLNEGLNILALTQAAATSAQMVSYVGKEVTIGDSSIFVTGDDDTVGLSFDLPEHASSVEVTITNESGEVVRTVELGARMAGPLHTSIDAVDEFGSPLPEGTYTYEVTALGKDGEPMEVSQHSTGLVESVVFENGYPELLLSDGRKVPLGQVVKVSTPGTIEALTTHTSNGPSQDETDENDATSASGLPVGAEGEAPESDEDNSADQNQEPMNQGV